MPPQQTEKVPLRTFFSTFPAGLGKPVEAALKATLPGVCVERLLDGLIVYRSDASPAELRKLSFLNNTFQAIEYCESVSEDPVTHMFRAALQDSGLRKALRGLALPQNGSFRVVVSREGRLVRANEGMRVQLEAQISRHTGQNIDRISPTDEFWILTRREGCGFFAWRLTRHRSYEKTLQRGELRPELASILCYISGPTAEDVFLDPFCGSGAIAVQRKALPYKAIFVSDIDRGKVRKLRTMFKRQIRRRDNRFNIRCDDALNLKRFNAGFITVIVTDPPWGEYEDLGSDPVTFYRSMLCEFDRILATHGTIVVLIGNKEEFKSAFCRYSTRFRMVMAYDILVSGKKAAIYKLKKSESAISAVPCQR
jgi:predicted RNA methylase